jgi:hypothetical protein
MKSFIQSQADNHRKAGEILTSIQVKLEVLAEMKEPNPICRVKTRKELKKLYKEYYEVVGKIFGIVDYNEEQKIENVVTIAESFHA